MAKRAGSRGRRYTAAQQHQVLDTEKKEKLTGAQVKKRFGVSTLTFYRWRGPVRSRRKGATARPGRDGVAAGNEGIRDQVRQTVREILPAVIRSEVNAYLDGLFSRRRPGRPRKNG